MLLLVFQLGESRYAMDAHEVVEVVPLLQLEPIAHAPSYAAGLFNFRGELAPVIDLRHLIQEQPCLQHMTTRIILIRYRPPDQEPRLLGLMAEQVTDILKRSREEFEGSGIRVADTPYLGDIAKDEQGMIHYLECQQLLPAAVYGTLFPSDAA